MALPEQKIFDAVATLSHALSADGLPPAPGEAAPDPASAIAALDGETKEVLGEAALAVAFGAFASRGGHEGPMHMLVSALGLMSVLAGQEPDPMGEVTSVLAEGEQVEAEIDRAGELVDQEFGREATVEATTAALEARILGSAILLAGCTLPEGEDGQDAVRLRAARLLVRLATGLVAMNVTSDETIAKDDAPDGTS